MLGMDGCFAPTGICSPNLGNTFVVKRRRMMDVDMRYIGDTFVESTQAYEDKDLDEDWTISSILPSKFRKIFGRFPLSDPLETVRCKFCNSVVLSSVMPDHYEQCQRELGGHLEPKISPLETPVPIDGARFMPPISFFTQKAPLIEKDELSDEEELEDETDSLVHPYSYILPPPRTRSQTRLTNDGFSPPMHPPSGSKSRKRNSSKRSSRKRSSSRKGQSRKKKTTRRKKKKAPPKKTRRTTSRKRKPPSKPTNSMAFLLNVKCRKRMRTKSTKLPALKRRRMEKTHPAPTFNKKGTTTPFVFPYFPYLPLTTWPQLAAQVAANSARAAGNKKNQPKANPAVGKGAVGGKVAPLRISYPISPLLYPFGNPALKLPAGRVAAPKANGTGNPKTVPASKGKVNPPLKVNPQIKSPFIFYPPYPDLRKLGIGVNKASVVKPGTKPNPSATKPTTTFVDPKKQAVKPIPRQGIVPPPKLAPTTTAALQVLQNNYITQLLRNAAIVQAMANVNKNNGNNNNNNSKDGKGGKKVQPLGKTFPFLYLPTHPLYKYIPLRTNPAISLAPQMQKSGAVNQQQQQQQQGRVRPAVPKVNGQQVNNNNNNNNNNNVERNKNGNNVNKPPLNTEKFKSGSVAGNGTNNPYSRAFMTAGAFPQLRPPIGGLKHGVTTPLVNIPFKTNPAANNNNNNNSGKNGNNTIVPPPNVNNNNNLKKQRQMTKAEQINQAKIIMENNRLGTLIGNSGLINPMIAPSYGYPYMFPRTLLPIQMQPVKQPQPQPQAPRKRASRRRSPVTRRRASRPRSHAKRKQIVPPPPPANRNAPQEPPVSIRNDKEGRTKFRELVDMYKEGGNPLNQNLPENMKGTFAMYQDYMRRHVNGDQDTEEERERKARRAREIMESTRKGSTRN